MGGQTIQLDKHLCKISTKIILDIFLGGHIPSRQALVESGAAFDETCLVRELLVDVPENVTLQGMDLESWGRFRAKETKLQGGPKNQSYMGWNNYTYRGEITPVTQWNPFIFGHL